MNKNLLNTVYMSQIQSTQDYACTVWGNCAQPQKDMIFRLQKRAGRIVNGTFDYEKSI